MTIHATIPEKNIGKKKSKDPTALEERRRGLDTFIREICEAFPGCILNNKTIYHNFASFFGPYQMGDARPPHFVSPFVLSE